MPPIGSAPSDDSIPTLPILPVSTIGTRVAKAVLVADEDDASRRLMIRVLRGVYDIYEATNGGHAGRVLEAIPSIACLVATTSLPEVTGFALARKMKVDPRFRNVPVILISRGRGESDLVEHINAGARAVLHRPLDLNDLLEKVASVLS
jgi:CheY-like chemotaxis protein